MKRMIILMEMIIFFCFLTGMASINNYSPEVNTAYEQLKSEVQEKGVEAQQITDSAKPIKDLLAQGVKKDDVKKFVLDLYNKKLDQASFKSSLESVSELTNDGEAFKQAKNLISKSLQDAQAQGLQGDELKKKVQSVVNQKKCELEELKKQASEKYRKIEEGAAKKLDDLQNKSLKEFLSGK